MTRLYFFLLLAPVLFMASRPSHSELDTKSVNWVLLELGDDEPPHSMKPDDSMIKKGEDLVSKGQTSLDDGKLSKPISKYFLCTHCHNTVREDPVIYELDPDDRLPYVVENKIPFLQSTTFWGIVNRESWYNDDYFLKYGESVRAANESLRAAIQLCAVECSQGRPLEQWEEDAILAYYWSIELQMSDLDIPDSLFTKIEDAINRGKSDSSLVNKLKKYYAKTSPAHFGDVLYDKKIGYDVEGDLLTGAQIYESSCRHCHYEGGVSDLLLDYAPNTFKYLKKHMFESSDLSIYQIIRKGTYASPGARPYMPHYPLEKMSDRQIESLRVFIEDRAK